MKNFFLSLFFIILFNNFSYSEEWQIINEWKISCGVLDKESLIVNSKPKNKYNKKKFQVNSAIFKIDKNEIGNCPTDKKRVDNNKYSHSGRQEINHILLDGKSIFETDILIEGAPAVRSTFFQIHDGRNKGAPPSWIGVSGGWKIVHLFPKEECSKENCKMIKYNRYVEPNKIYKFKAEIDYVKKEKKVSVKYFLNDEFILQHLNVPLGKKRKKGPYKYEPYIKIGIYRIGETGTTQYTYNNILFKNKR